MRTIIPKLIEKTGRTQQECEIINAILNERFIVGRNNKDKIVADFEERLSITHDEADELYNQCASIIVKGVLRKD